MPISGDAVIRYFRAAGYRFLPIELEHAAATETLPKHHRDPFDRLLVTQARVEPLRLLSRDPMQVRYGDFVALV